MVGDLLGITRRHSEAILLCRFLGVAHIPLYITGEKHFQLALVAQASQAFDVGPVAFQLLRYLLAGLPRTVGLAFQEVDVTGEMDLRVGLVYPASLTAVVVGSPSLCLVLPRNSSRPLCHL